jgi:hypothetical protein
MMWWEGVMTPQHPQSTPHPNAPARVVITTGVPTSAFPSTRHSFAPRVTWSLTIRSSVRA